MNKYILLSFIFLGWFFWELSGGRDFTPDYHDARTAKYGAAPESPSPTQTPAAESTRPKAKVEVAAAETSRAQARANVTTAAPTVSLKAQSNSPQPTAQTVTLTEPVQPVPSFSADSSIFSTTTSLEDAPPPQTALVFKSPSITITDLALNEANTSFDATTMTFANTEPDDGTNVPASSLPLLPKPKLLQVRGSRVNLRSGPGTSHDVIEVLLQGSITEVVEDNGGGWLKLRVQDSGRIGWMSRRMLEPLG